MGFSLFFPLSPPSSSCGMKSSLVTHFPFFSGFAFLLFFENKEKIALPDKLSWNELKYSTFFLVFSCCCYFSSDGLPKKKCTKFRDFLFCFVLHLRVEKMQQPVNKKGALTLKMHAPTNAETRGYRFHRLLRPLKYFYAFMSLS